MLFDSSLKDTSVGYLRRISSSVRSKSKLSLPVSLKDKLLELFSMLFVVNNFKLDKLLPKVWLDNCSASKKLTSLSICEEDLIFVYMYKKNSKSQIGEKDHYLNAFFTVNNKLISLAMINYSDKYNSKSSSKNLILEYVNNIKVLNDKK